MSIAKPLWFGLVAGISLIASPAYAGPILPGTVLPPNYPVSIDHYTQAGFIVPGATAESQSPGFISYSYCYPGSPSCAYGQSDVEIGYDPSLSAFVHTTCSDPYPCSHSDDYSPVSSGSAAILNYSVELIDPGKTAPEPVQLRASDLFNLTGESGASYVFTLTGITNALKIQDCVGRGTCIEGIAHGSIASITNVMLVPNSVYYVNMQLYAGAYGHTGDSAYASLDPIFSLPAGSTGVLAYSAGVTGAVPEPASWALMVSGFGLAGALLRRRRTSELAAALS